MSAAEHLPVTLLTGFLGSGKTTLLRRLLEHPDMGECALLINEFGEIGIDHLLVQEVTDDIVLLDSGCVCCSVRGEFQERLLELAARRRKGELPPFRRVMVETTGMADPAPIVHVLMAEPELAEIYRLEGVVTVLDAVLGAGQLARHAESARQVTLADRLLLSKSDLASEVERTATLNAARALNPRVPVFDEVRERPAPGVLLGVGPGELGQRVHEWLGHGAHADHGNDRGDHARVATFTLTYSRPVPWERFRDWLGALLAARAEDILRVKGLLHVQGREGPVLIQGVQHMFFPPRELASWPDGRPATQLVFIVEDLSGAALQASLEEYMEDTG